MSTELAKLRDLDRYDQKLLRLRRQLADLPLELAPTQKRVAEAEIELEQLRLLQKHLRKEIKSHELDTDTNNQQVGRYRSQQNTAKTNEEYAALKRQIEALERKNDDLEDKALLAYEKLDELARREKELLAAREKDRVTLAREQEEVDAETAKLGAEIEALEAERGQILRRLIPEFTRIYERLLERFGGRALATVEGKKCQGCFLDLPTQKLCAVHAGNEVVHCPQCNRILYLD